MANTDYTDFSRQEPASREAFQSDGAKSPSGPSGPLALQALQAHSDDDDRETTPKPSTPVPEAEDDEAFRPWTAPLPTPSRAPPSPKSTGPRPEGPEEEAESQVMKQARAMTANEVLLEKEGLLQELAMMESQGMFKLPRPLSVDDSLDEIQFQYDRANALCNTQQAVSYAKTGIRMGSAMLEGFARKMGINALDGFSAELCKDMNKFNRPVTKMYRRYWRRTQVGPEMEIAWIIAAAAGATVYKNKGPSAAPPAPAAPQQGPQAPPQGPQQGSRLPMMSMMPQGPSGPAQASQPIPHPQMPYQQMPVLPMMPSAMAASVPLLPAQSSAARPVAPVALPAAWMMPVPAPAPAAPVAPAALPLTKQAPVAIAPVTPHESIRRITIGASSPRSPKRKQQEALDLDDDDE